MAVSDKSIEHLTKSIEGLVKTIKDKNSFGSDSEKSTRLGRGGSSNASDASGANFKKSLDSLRDLHKSMKSGGVSIADHFAKIAKNTVPLNKALSDLEDTFAKVAKEFGEQYKEIAKSAAEYIKKNEGNAAKLQQTAKVHEEYAEVQKEILKIHKMDAKNLKENATEIRKLIAREEELRKKYNDAEFSKANDLTAASGAFVGYMHNLSKSMNSLTPSSVKLSGKTLKKVERDIEHFGRVNETIHAVFTKFANNMEKGLRDAEKKVTDGLNKFANALGAAALDSARRIPGVISSRIQQGVGEYDFSDAARMGLSPEELYGFQSGIRDITNVMSGFGQNADFDASSTLRDLTHDLKRMGLTGVEASEYLSQTARGLYRTGSIIDEESLNRMNTVAQNIQQVFGGTISDASKKFHDYNTQIFNLSRYNAAQTEEQRLALEEELTQRMKLAKYMGVEVEYLVQQQAMRNNNAMKGLTDAIRGAVSGRVGLEMLRYDGLNMTAEDTKFMSTVQAFGIDSVDPESQKRYHELAMQLEMYRQDHVDRQRNAFESSGGNMGAALAASGMGRIGMPYVEAGGIDMAQNQEIYAPAIAAYRRHQEAGTLDQFDMMAAMNAAQAEGNKSETLLLNISENIQGFLKNPFTGLITAIGANVGALIWNTLALKRWHGGVGNMFGRSRGKGPVAGPAGGKGRGSRLPGGMTGRMRLGSPIAMASGFALGAVADSMGTDTKAGAGVDVLSGTLGGAGTGALIGSIIPGIGTAVGGAVGGLIGGGYSLYKNRETLLEGITPESIGGATKGAALGSLILPGIGTAVGGMLGSVFSRGTSIDTGTITADRAATTFGSQTDTMNKVVRDNQGNPVVVDSSKSEELLEKIAVNSEKQRELAEEDLAHKKMREEQQDARLAQQNSVREHINNLSEAIGRSITVPS